MVLAKSVTMRSYKNLYAPLQDTELCKLSTVDDSQQNKGVASNIQFDCESRKRKEVANNESTGIESKLSFELYQQINQSSTVDYKSLDHH